MSRPPRKLILHIGHRKAGSTSIQRALATGSVEIDGKKPLYPTKWNHNYLPRLFDAYAEDEIIVNGPPHHPNLRELSDLLENKDYAFAVLSGEHFEVAKPRIVKEVMQRFFLPHVDQHAIICYVRPHAARILSSFSEQTKNGGFNGSIVQFAKQAMSSGRFKYSNMLSPWISEFGDHFIARPMVRDTLVNGSLLDDFNSHAFPRAEVQYQEVESANGSLCVEDLVFVRYIQQQLIKRRSGVRLNISWIMAAALTSKPRYGKITKLKLHQSLAEDIRKHYLSDAQKLDRTIFASSPVMVSELDKAVDTALSEPQSLEPSDHFSADTLRYIAVIGNMMDSMMDNEGKPWPDYLNDRRIRVNLGLPDTPAKKAGKKAGKKAESKRAGKLYHSQKGQDRWVIEDIHNYKENGYFVDLAAADGIKHSNTFALEKKFGWSGVCIEPNPLFFGNLTKSRNCHCIQSCISNIAGEVDFRIDNGQLGGIVSDNCDNNYRMRGEQLQNAEIIKLKTETLESLLDRVNAPRYIDYLSLDVEGNEEAIICSFDFTKYNFLAMTIERPTPLVNECLFDCGYIFVKNFKNDSFYVHETFKDRVMCQPFDQVPPKSR